MGQEQQERQLERSQCEAVFANGQRAGQRCAFRGYARRQDNQRVVCGTHEWGDFTYAERSE
jgi:hypothetical protein